MMNSKHDLPHTLFFTSYQWNSEMKYIRIFSDEEGESHFDDVEVQQELVEFAPPAPPVLLSQFIPARQFTFLTFPQGWQGDWHPAPARQFFFLLSGNLEGTVSDSEKRIIGPGCIVLLEDTAGKGHLTRVVGSEDVSAIVIQLPE
jgi:mannose-6-phosphate isomerase-like protein (cupin superfamily)